MWCEGAGARDADAERRGACAATGARLLVVAHQIDWRAAQRKETTDPARLLIVVLGELCDCRRASAEGSMGQSIDAHHRSSVERWVTIRWQREESAAHLGHGDRGLADDAAPLNMRRTRFVAERPSNT